MEVKASLNNLRISSRKVRQVTNLVKGMKAEEARAQLTFLVKKPAPIVLKLLNSALANAKHNFNISEENLYVKRLMVEGGPSLKRWLPRAMGRATPLLKRTSSIKMILSEIKPSAYKSKKEKKDGEAAEKRGGLPENQIDKVDTTDKGSSKAKKPAVDRPHGASTQSKKRNFSRQAVSGPKKTFRRKSI